MLDLLGKGKKTCLLLFPPLGPWGKMPAVVDTKSKL